MGSYDEFMGKCPHCQEEFISQTKLFGEDLRIIKPGSAVGNHRHHYYYWTGNVQCKEPCKCGQLVVAIIEKGILKKLVKPEDGKPYQIEGPWGSVSKIIT